MDIRVTTGPERLRVHVVYEHDLDGRPHASSHLRLLRPLGHPAVRDAMEVTTGADYGGERVDAVLVDRLWRPDVSLSLARGLVDRVHRGGARLVYCLDDNLLDLRQEREDWPSAEHVLVIELLLRRADLVVVTTTALRARVFDYNAHTVVMPNTLDERLLVGGAAPRWSSAGDAEPTVIGYMGTRSHDADLMMVLPALRALARRHRIELQLVGVTRDPATLDALADLPVRLLHPDPAESEYPLFMLWFGSQVAWDLAIAPLRATPFGRCKSDVKFLDYAAIGVAGVYSHMPAYAETVRHGDTGLLAADDPTAWEDALERLLRDRPERRRLARAATAYLWRERVLARRAHHWPALLRPAVGAC